MMFAKRMVGLDFRENHIICAVVKKKRNQIRIEQLEVGHIAEQWLDSDGIEEAFELDQHLHKIFKAAFLRKIKRKKVNLCIPTEHVVLRRITSLPDLQPEALAQLLQVEMKENIPLPFEQPIFDFVKTGVIERLPEGKSKQIYEQAFAEAAATLHVHAEQEESHTELEAVKDHSAQDLNSDLILMATSAMLSAGLAEGAQKIGLKPVSAEIRAHALQRFIQAAHPQYLQELEVVVDVAEQSSDIHIFQAGICKFTRNLSTLGMQQYVLADIAGFDEEQLCEDISMEIERAVNFLKHSLGERDQTVQRLILTGQYTYEMVAKLSSLTGITTSEVQLDHFKQARVYPQQILAMSSVAIGLALRNPV